MRRRTKIVCTIGPAVDSREAIGELIRAGMNVARLNCSHGDWESRARWIGWIRELSPDLAPVGILVDLQGPKFRIGKLVNNQIDLKPGQLVTAGEDLTCDIPISQTEILAEMQPGDRLLLGDGNVELKIKGGDASCFKAVAVTGGIVRSRQGLTLVGKSFQIPAFTPQDEIDLRKACELDVDFAAMSYVHSAEEIMRMRRVVEGCKTRIRICAKIETRAAIRNLSDILRATDIAMVARGDLGLQMNLEDVPSAQKEIIRQCNLLGKPVITATQMLESMMTAPRPTRAEVADVANAILDGTDAVMLSGETASGAYPVACVETMARIALKTEKDLNHEQILERQGVKEAGKLGATHAIARSVVRLAEAIRPKAILTTSTSGQTACLVSKYRPQCPVLCATWNEKTHKQLSVAWGVEAIHIPLPKDTDGIVHNAMEGFVRHKRLKPGDHVIVTAGVPAGSPGNTNLILHETVK